MAGVKRDTDRGPEYFNGRMKLRKMEEIVTIPVGSGAAPIVTTATNMYPAGIVLSVGFKVIEPPGGGATTLSIGVSGAGDDNRFIDAASCDLVGESGTSPQDGDGLTVAPGYNKTAAALELTTDGDVTVHQMLVKVVTTYLEFANVQ